MRWVQENALIEDVQELRSTRLRSSALLRDAALAANTRLEAAEEQLGRRDSELAAAQVSMLWPLALALVAGIHAARGWCAPSPPPPRQPR